MELKPTRLKIKAQSNLRQHSAMVLDEYYIEGVKRVDVAITPEQLAVVTLQVYAKDVDIEIPGVPEDLPIFPKPSHLEYLTEVLKKSGDRLRVLSVDELEKLIEEWRELAETDAAIATMTDDQQGKECAERCAARLRDCARDLENMISSKSETLPDFSGDQS